MPFQPSELSIRQVFECFRVDSAACGDLFPGKLHSHYFSEIIIVRSGVCRITRGNHILTLNPGELVYISPLIRHNIESADGAPVVFDVVKFSATRLRELPSYFTDLRAVAMDAAQSRLQIHMTAEEAREFHMDNIIRECIVESTRRDFAWELHTRALICLLITNLARFWLSRRESFLDHLPKKRNPILDITAYIEQHISEPLRVEELASMCGLSYPWFAKRFHELFGISCKQFIERLRVENVELYLVCSDLDLASISSRSGYTDCSHMVKEFRRLTGTTPGQFRTTMKTQGLTANSLFSGQTVPIHPPKA